MVSIQSGLAFGGMLSMGIFAGATAGAAEGSLRFSIADESDGQPIVARVELTRSAITPQGKTKSITPRRTAKAGMGFILDREIDLSLGDGGYQFRIVRGPEYRIISGNFSLSRTSDDSHHVDLPRMVSMVDHGWVSGDMAVPVADKSLPLRMAGEDLHVAMLPAGGDTAKRPMVAGIARGPQDPLRYDPLWTDNTVTFDQGLAFYGIPEQTASKDLGTLPVARLVAAKRSSDSVRTAIENPFAMALPVWLASEKADGFFLLGDWLRLDRKVTRVGRGDRGFPWSATGGKDVGRWAEKIYWNTLEAGLRLVPLAGSGDQAGKTPIGYNRVYATAEMSHSYPGDTSSPQSPVDLASWQDSVWQGRTMVTNGPMLRALANGRVPGHVFAPEADGNVRINVTIDLATRDPVDYMEVIHNGRIHYNARLDEFARSRGVIPAIETDRSGWVLVRVVTLHEDHFRAASTAPWFIDVPQRPRVSAEACRFFQAWLGDYEAELKKLPAESIAPHVPYVQSARRFWNHRLESATD